MSDRGLQLLLGRLAPEDHKALAQICETADLVVFQEKPHLLVPADAALIDRLGAFGADVEDCELEADDEDADPGGPGHDDLEPEDEY